MYIYVSNRFRIIASGPECGKFAFQMREFLPEHPGCITLELLNTLKQGCQAIRIEISDIELDSQKIFKEQELPPRSRKWTFHGRVEKRKILTIKFQKG